MQWYYLNEAGEVLGPVPEETLMELRSSGKIHDETPVCRVGTEVWISLSESIGQNQQDSHAAVDSLKFGCPHCGQHIAADPSDAGASTQCPTCGGEIVVPGGTNTSESAVAPSRQRKRKPVLMKSIVGLVGLLIIGGIIAWVMGTGGNGPNGTSGQNESSPDDMTKTSPTPDSDENPLRVFSAKSSNKDEILGLRGGMSMEEVMATLKLEDLKPAHSILNYSTPWKSDLPGFSAYEFKPADSFPIKHLTRILLYFLNDRLQSLCYEYVSMPIQISLYKNNKVEISMDSQRYSYSALRDDGYDRKRLIGDVRAIVGGSFEVIDDTLYPDYTSGRYIPKDGNFNERHPKGEGHSAYSYSASPIFNACSSEIFVRFYSFIENKDSILENLSYQIMSPELFRADATTSEFFFLQFSFRNTYLESLSAAQAYEAKESEKRAAEQSEARRKREDAEAKERRAEEDRVKKLREGL